MDRHVTVLSLLIGIWGALAMLLGISLLLLAGGALAVLLGPDGDSVGLAAGLTTGMFSVLGACALAWGGAHVRAGVLLRRRHGSGRILTLVLATMDLLLLPFGTALGAYALWVLLTHDGRRLFQTSAPSVAG